MSWNISEEESPCYGQDIKAFWIAEYSWHDHLMPNHVSIHITLLDLFLRIKIVIKVKSTLDALPISSLILVFIIVAWVKLSDVVDLT